MKVRYVMQRDTRSWTVQVWIAFALALLACAIGVINVPGDPTDHGFLIIGLFFSLFSCFALAKTERDNRDGQVDTQSWIVAVWAALAVSMSITAWGLWAMPMEVWAKRYMVVAWLFMVSSCFTLAKTLRDRHEADLLEQQARAERLKASEAAASA